MTILRLSLVVSTSDFADTPWLHAKTLQVHEGQSPVDPFQTVFSPPNRWLLQEMSVRQAVLSGFVIAFCGQFRLECDYVLYIQD